MTGWATAAQVVASLVVVLVLVVLAGRFARRAGVRGEGAGLRVVERVGLTRETAVAVVEIGGRYLVVGTSAHGVTLLTELDASQVTARRDRRGADSGGVRVTRVVAPAAPARTPANPARPPAGPPTGTPARTPDRTPDRTPAVTVRTAAGTAAGTVPAPRGSGAVLDPRTWKQGLDALRDLTVRRG